MTTIYRYDPVLFDACYDSAVKIGAGTLVRKVQPRHGCPRNGTMGMSYVETLDGTFVGLRCNSSLKRVATATVKKGRS